MAAQAQTPITTVENGENEVRLELSHNGSLVVPGELVVDGTENDSILATGAGTRLMWYPEKAAFRAGSVGSSSGKEDVWDADSIGFQSVAFGSDTRASGDRSVAMGISTIASDLQATAMGQNTEASGQAATSMGVQTIAATSYSVSVGQCNDANTTSDGTLFVVGNGGRTTSGCNRSDALVLDSNGNLMIAGSLTESSDRRLKTNVDPLGKGTLEALIDLRPVRFTFKDEETHPSGPQLGVIAQEVQEVFPELVSEGPDGYLSVAYPKLSAVLLKGLQEQQNQISDLKAENEKIKERLAALEAKQSSSTMAGLTELEKRLAKLEAKEQTALAGLPGPWSLLLALGAFGAGLLWRRQA